MSMLWEQRATGVRRDYGASIVCLNQCGNPVIEASEKLVGDYLAEYEALDILCSRTAQQCNGE